MHVLSGHGGGCCGAVHLYNFPYNEPTGVQKKVVRRLIKQAVEEHGNELGLPLVAVILDVDQIDFWEKFLVDKLGFRKVTTWTNPNTDNPLTMYVVDNDTYKGKL